MTDVLVVGAGPTGLAAAVVLREGGAAVRVVDAAEGPSGASRAKGVQPRTLEVLEQFGLAAPLISHGRFRMPLRRYADPGDRVGVDVLVDPEATASPEVPWARTLLVPQWRTEQVLRERLAELGVAVEWGVRLHGLADRGDRVVARTGAAEVSEITARYVVGADGGGSTVRGQLGVAFLGETREEVRLLLGDVRLAGLDRDAWHQWSSEAQPFLALCPLPSTDAFQFQGAVIGAVPAEGLGPEVFQAAVDAVTGGVRVREVTWASRWRLNVRMFDRYRVGRVFLAGDAAHVHSPAGAQGMNTGIQDAVNLGWRLGAVLRGAPEELLDGYERERLPVAAGVLGLSSRLTGRPLTERGGETLQLHVSYREGPAGEGPLPGDRAPDAPLLLPDGRAAHLFDLLRGARPTVLGFGVRPTDDPGDPGDGGGEGAARVLEVGVDVLDPEGLLARAYRAEEGDIVRIRPDRHLGSRSRAAGSARRAG